MDQASDGKTEAQEGGDSLRGTQERGPGAWQSVSVPVSLCVCHLCFSSSYIIHGKSSSLPLLGNLGVVASPL